MPWTISLRHRCRCSLSRTRRFLTPAVCAPLLGGLERVFVRRARLHREFHARGCPQPPSKASPGPLPACSRPEVAKVLKAIAWPSKKLFSTIISLLFHPQSAFRGLHSFSPFLHLLFFHHVERVCLLVLITASRPSFFTYSSLCTAPPAPIQS